MSKAAKRSDKSKTAKTIEQQRVEEQELAERQFHERAQDLAYKTFVECEAGAQFLQLLEYRYFYNPVAHWSFTQPQCHFNEGRNDLIRYFKLLCHQHLQNKRNKSKPKALKKKRG